MHLQVPKDLNRTPRAEVQTARQDQVVRFGTAAAFVTVVDGFGGVCFDRLRRPEKRGLTRPWFPSTVRRELLAETLILSLRTPNSVKTNIHDAVYASHKGSGGATLDRPV